jgi:hypothetical protein
LGGGGDRDPDLGGDMGPTFKTPILELMLNVISKIKQNYSDMNEIILAPCDAGYVQSCTGFLKGSKIQFKKNQN